MGVQFQLKCNFTEISLKFQPLFLDCAQFRTHTGTAYLLLTYRYRYSTSPPAITLCQQCANSVLTALLVQCANTTSGLGVDTPRMEKCANSVLTLVRKAWRRVDDWLAV